MNVSGSRDHQRCLFETLYKLPQLDWLGHDVPEDSHLTVLEYPKLLSRLREASFHWKWNSHLLSTTGGIEGLGIGFDGSNVQADGGNAMWIMLRKIPNLKRATMRSVPTSNLAGVASVPHIKDPKIVIPDMDLDEDVKTLVARLKGVRVKVVEWTRWW
jgi:hypothetical protein